MTLIPNLKSPVFQSVIEIDSRSRIRIPNQIAAQLKWLKNDQVCYGLIVLDEPGRLTIHSWEVESPPVLKKQKQLVEESAASYEAVELLLQLEDRYIHQKISQLRPTLPAEVILHLGVSRKSEVYIRRVRDTIELLSPRYRNENRIVIDDYLP